MQRIEITWPMDYNFGDEQISIRTLENIQSTVIMLDDDPVGYIEDFEKDFDNEIIILKLKIGSSIEPLRVDQLEFSPLISKQDKIHKTELVGVKAVPKDFGVKISQPEDKE